MRNIWTIAMRDYRSFFKAPLGFVIIAAFLAMMGYFFHAILGVALDQMMQMGRPGAGKPQPVAFSVIRPLYMNINFVFLCVVPAITMRLFAEEKKFHTIELLMTSPVKTWEMVIGKFLSGYLFTLTLVGATLIYPLITLLVGNPDPGVILTSLIGVALIAGVYISTGLLVSAATESIVVALFVTFFLNLFLWVIGWSSQSAGGVMGEVLEYLSIIAHMRDFTSGVINTSDVVFYLSFVGIVLFLTHRLVESTRWR